MEKRNILLLLGAMLILIGLVFLAVTALLPVYGVDVLRWGMVRAWPLTLAAAGAGLILPSLLIGPSRRWMGSLYIPGMSLLTTGVILTFCSLTGWWTAWRWLWPLEVLGLAVGFGGAAIHMRLIWLLIPAMVLGVNGVFLQFCALTGLWPIWAVIWPVEPLTVGLILFAIGMRQRRNRLALAGTILSIIAAFCLIGTVALVSAHVFWVGHRWLRTVVAILLILIGGMLMLGRLPHRVRRT